MSLSVALPAPAPPHLRLHAACEAGARLLAAIARWFKSVPAAATLPACRPPPPCREYTHCLSIVYVAERGAACAGAAAPAPARRVRGGRAPARRHRALVQERAGRRHPAVSILIASLLSMSLSVALPAPAPPHLRLHAACEAGARLLAAIARWFKSVPAAATLP
ncbi:unnamed protein product [Arctia plantaginis]|uniref:Uncharacterized protein n=1 Tax=Arctia plantaginis TaxID=874455 RepID=A0A8S1A9C7_ARCPL|nr:unnamed protein product [Arctia plantaginis]CAB3241414.1 unnamed protein product [Arctia plantaginis]CAB3241415.1 unnamed protein product [Arctia plantaginis]CAB3241416.1 unnamed protein product [Arctia plantaginis]